MEEHEKWEDRREQEAKRINNICIEEGCEQEGKWTLCYECAQTICFCREHWNERKEKGVGNKNWGIGHCCRECDKESKKEEYKEEEEEQCDFCTNNLEWDGKKGNLSKKRNAVKNAKKQKNG